MRIVAIDIGTKFTGIVCGPDDFYLDTLTADEGDLAEKRLIKIARKVVNVVEDYNAEYVILEDYAMGRVFNVEVAELVGMVKLELSKLGGFKFGMLNPSLVRAIVFGKGDISEGEIKKTITNMYGRIWQTVHEADALTIYTAVNMFLREELDDHRMRLVKRRIYEL